MKDDRRYAETRGGVWRSCPRLSHRSGSGLGGRGRGLGTATTVGAQPPRSGYCHDSRGLKTVGVLAGSGAALRWRVLVGDKVSGLPRPGPRPRQLHPDPNSERSEAKDPARTPTVGRPRLSWQYPDCSSCAPTVVAVPRPPPATPTPTKMRNRKPQRTGSDPPSGEVREIRTTPPIVTPTTVSSSMAHCQRAVCPTVASSSAL